MIIVFKATSQTNRGSFLKGCWLQLSWVFFLFNTKSCPGCETYIWWSQQCLANPRHTSKRLMLHPEISAEMIQKSPACQSLIPLWKWRAKIIWKDLWDLCAAPAENENKPCSETLMKNPGVSACAECSELRVPGSFGFYIWCFTESWNCWGWKNPPGSSVPTWSSPHPPEQCSGMATPNLPFHGEIPAGVPPEPPPAQHISFGMRSQILPAREFCRARKSQTPLDFLFFY